MADENNEKSCCYVHDCYFTSYEQLKELQRLTRSLKMPRDAIYCCFDTKEKLDKYFYYAQSVPKMDFTFCLESDDYQTIAKDKYGTPASLKQKIKKCSTLLKTLQNEYATISKEIKPEYENLATKVVNLGAEEKIRCDNLRQLLGEITQFIVELNEICTSIDSLFSVSKENNEEKLHHMIIDQSPGLLDTSVIRNTNTKIIMRLPESGDREIVGNAIGLNSQQMYEISKLKTGVAVVYQKDWLEAVLCNVEEIKHEESVYKYNPDTEEHIFDDISIEEARGEALSVLTPFSSVNIESAERLQNVAETLCNSNGSDKELADLLFEYLKTKKQRERGQIEPYASLVWNITDIESVWEFIFDAVCKNDISYADVLLRQQIKKYITCGKDTETAVINLLLQKKGRNKKVKDFYLKWAWKYMFSKNN